MILVVDGNFYLHRCWFTLKTSRPIEDVLPHNFLSLVAKDAVAVKATSLLIGFDGPEVFRYKIYRDYKANRREGDLAKQESERGDVYDYLPAVREYLTRLGVVWIQSKIHEADDILRSAARQYEGPIVLGTGDKDSNQSLEKGVRIYNSQPNVPQWVDEESILKRYGLRPEQWVMYQTLLGDKGDNVPQILSPSKAKACVLKWGSFERWFKEGSAEDKKWLRSHQVKLKLNRQLVELVSDVALPQQNLLKIPKAKTDSAPKSWFILQDQVWPKSKGLFR